LIILFKVVNFLDNCRLTAQNQAFSCFYIFLRYCPPTSNSAAVICPNEQYLVDSISCSNKFLLCMAACLRSVSNLGACAEKALCILLRAVIWYSFSSVVDRITSLGITDGEPLDERNIFTPTIGYSPVCFSLSSYKLS